MANITYNLKLEVKEEDSNLLLNTFLQHQKVWNHMSEYTFKTKNIDKKLIHDNNYHQCRNLFPECPSQIIIRAKDSVYASYKTIKSNHVLGNLEEPAIQSNLAIRLDSRLYTFLDKNQIKLTTVGKRIICEYKTYEKFNELFSKYTVCDPLIFFRENQFYIAITFELPEPTYIETSYLGVDLGLRRIAVTSEGKAIQDKDYLKHKRKLRYLKRVLKNKKTTTNSHSARTKLQKVKHQEQNYNKNFCHKVANEILKTNASTIVLEDLSSLKDNKLGKKNYCASKSSKNRLSQMPFYLLLQILTYKAPLFGKKVVTVDPAFTSQDDFRGIERGERKGCRYYASDGRVLDADWNGSLNIANRYKMHSKSEEKHPVSSGGTSNCGYDGCLDFVGRRPSTRQVRVSEKSRTLQ